MTLAPEERRALSAPFGVGAFAWLVTAVWTVVGCGLLARYAARREL